MWTYPLNVLAQYSRTPTQGRGHTEVLKGRLAQEAHNRVIRASTVLGMSRFNLDAIAGQAPSQEVEQAVWQARSMAWSDPESLHFEGKQAANLLEVSRESVAKGIGVPRDQVTFAISTAEAIRYVLKTVQPSVILYSPIERKVVLDTIADSGLPTTALFVNSKGHIDQADLAEKLSVANSESTPSSKPLVFIQWANQEIGTVQNLRELAVLIAAAGAALAVDATSALGYVPTSSIDSCWDYLFADASSWGGSRTATLLASTSSKPSPSTTSVAEVATAAVSLEALLRSQPGQSESLSLLRTRLESALRNQGSQGDQFDQVDLVDPGEPRLPQVVSFAFPFVDSEVLATELDRRGVAIGSGSACSSEPGETSHVLSAIGSMTHGNVRVSLPIDCPPEAVERLLELLPPLISELREN